MAPQKRTRRSNATSTVTVEVNNQLLSVGPVYHIDEQGEDGQRSPNYTDNLDLLASVAVDNLNRNNKEVSVNLKRIKRDADSSSDNGDTAGTGASKPIKVDAEQKTAEKDHDVKESDKSDLSSNETNNLENNGQPLPRIRKMRILFDRSGRPTSVQLHD